MKLTDFAKNCYSAFGEDGIIQHIFDTIGTDTRFCVEFGAGDDIQGSNVANLWKMGWHTLLIEADPARYGQLMGHIPKESRVQTRNAKVLPTGGASTDMHLAGQPVPDLMSIDVDGNDYHIWKEMQARPRVICIEFNPTVPPHLAIYQSRDDENYMGFGTSLKAVIELGKWKGYEFIGATHCNAFFVAATIAGPFLEYERDPIVQFPLTGYTFLITDFTGQALAVGNNAPWGIRTPYVGPFLNGDPVQSVSADPESTMDAYGAIVRWSGALWPNIADNQGGAPDLLLHMLRNSLTPICINITNVSSPNHLEWIRPLATKNSYQMRFGGGILALVKENK